MFTEVKNSLRPDPTPQPETACEALNISVSLVQPNANVTALQPPSQLLPSDTPNIITTLASASTRYEVLQDPSVPLKLATFLMRAVQRKEPPVNTKINLSSPEGAVELVCRVCDIKRSRTHLQSGV